MNPLFLIAGGPSLRGFDYSALDGLPMMTINWMALVVSGKFTEKDHDITKPFDWEKVDRFPELTHWRDPAFNAKMNGYQGLGIVPKRILQNSEYVAPECDIEVYGNRHVRNGGKPGKRDIIGKTSGVSGLHHAVLRGFDPIFLMGYDYWEDKNGSHCYTNKHAYYWDHKKPGDGPDERYMVYRRSMPGFDTIRNHYDTEIYNLSESSMVEAFPYKSFEDCINGT